MWYIVFELDRVPVTVHLIAELGSGLRQDDAWGRDEAGLRSWCIHPAVCRGGRVSPGQRFSPTVRAGLPPSRSTSPRHLDWRTLTEAGHWPIRKACNSGDDFRIVTHSNKAQMAAAYRLPAIDMDFLLGDTMRALCFQLEYQEAELTMSISDALRV